MNSIRILELVCAFALIFIICFSGIYAFIQWRLERRRMIQSSKILDEVNRRYPGPKTLEQWDKYIAELEAEGFGFK